MLVPHYLPFEERSGREAGVLGVRGQKEADRGTDMDSHSLPPYALRFVEEFTPVLVGSS